jgi:hypothetical protein
VGAKVNFKSTATDNCDPNPTIVCVDQNGKVVKSGDVFPPGVHTITCTATDACNNKGTCTFTFEVLRCPESRLPFRSSWT